MTNLCSMNDFYIMNKIRSGEWVPSLDTGQVYSNKKKDFLVPSRQKDNYLTISGISVSHIIWVAANGAIPYGMQIDHINEDRADNRLCNLQLTSASENRTLSVARLTYAQAEEIRRRYAEGGTSYRKLAREYNVSDNVIGRILNNCTYTKLVDTSNISQETRQKILEAYKKGRQIDTIRKVLKIQRAVIRQVLEEELNREAEERKKQENES